MRKLPGVQSVEVSLERAVTEIRLTDGNTVSLAQLRKILKDGGSGAADVEVVGTLMQRDGAPAIAVAKTPETFRIVSDPKNPEPFKWVMAAVGKPGSVVLSGRIGTDALFVVSKAALLP